jgi:ubiquitin carboxyl-terminal hydrolase 8
MTTFVGLLNLGNTCFLNSCVQVLKSIPELHQIIVENINHIKESPDTTMLKEWADLYSVMNSANGTLSPNKFVHIVQQVAQIKGRDIFTGWAQNDIQEFLLFLIECFHNSIARPARVHINGIPENHTDQRAIICYGLIQSVYAREYSKILDVFYGVYMTEIVDIDNSTILSTTAEHYFVLDLQLFYREKICSSIYDCFDLFIQPELMEGDNAWWNEKTQEKQSIYKQVNFWSFPDILVIMLKRFSPDGVRKLQNLIDFPLENLDLSRFAKGYGSQKNVYDLFGVCNHMGGVLGGHYTAFVKSQDKWFHYNDSTIEPVLNPQSIVSPSAYCLFYRKKIPSCSI